MSKDNGGPASDRELLEMAAKAAGLHVKGWVGDRMVFFNPITGSAEEHWNPITDDGDALRLAVKLDISFFGDFPQDVVVAAFDARKIAEIKNPDDPCASTRRAIVRAAAAIGAGLAPFPTADEIRENWT